MSGRTDQREHAAVANQTAFPTLLIPISGPVEQEKTANPSRLRRLTKIPSWVRGRSSDPPPAGAAHRPSSSRRATRSAPRPPQLSPPSPIIRIPPSPTQPPPLPPIHPRATRLSFRVGTFLEPRRQATSFTAPNSSQGSSPLLPESSPRRRSVSSPSFDTPPSKRTIITPRRPIVSSSWDDDRLPKRQSLPHYDPSTNASAASHRQEASSSSANSYSTLHDNDTDGFSAPSSARTLNDDTATATIPKLDFVTHFESITHLNLKMESGEELTAEELGRGLKYLFSRYHGVLDSVGAFKTQLDDENAELKMQVDSLQQQLRNNDTELHRLRSLLAEHGINARLSSDSGSTVRGHLTSNAPSQAASPTGPSDHTTGSPGRALSLPLAPSPVSQGGTQTSVDSQRFVSRVPLPSTSRASPLENNPPINNEPRAI